MEKEHLIIIAILGVILYMCMNKSEGFNYQQGGIGDFDLQRIRYDAPGPINRIRYQDAPLTLSQNPKDEPITMNRIRSNMNIMGSQHVRNHIRSDRRNNMMSSMMYGYTNGDSCEPNCPE